MTGRAGRWDSGVRPRAQRQLARLPGKIATAAAGFMPWPLLENPHRVGHLLRDEYADTILPAAGLTGVFAIGAAEDTGTVIVLDISDRSDTHGT